MVVASYTTANRGQWDDFVGVSSSGTFFHTINWKTVIEKAFGYTSLYFFVEDQGHIKGVLPLFLVKKPLRGRVLISVPFGVYGGDMY